MDDKTEMRIARTIEMLRWHANELERLILPKRAKARGNTDDIPWRDYLLEWAGVEEDGDPDEDRRFLW